MRCFSCQISLTTALGALILTDHGCAVRACSSSCEAERLWEPRRAGFLDRPQWGHI